MSVEAEVDGILAEEEPGRVSQPADAEVEEAVSEGESSNVLGLAVTEAKRLFAVTGVSLADVCTAVEEASARAELQEALGRLNQFLHIFLGLQSDQVEARDILSAVASLQSSDTFKEFLVS